MRLHGDVPPFLTHAEDSVFFFTGSAQKQDKPPDSGDMTTRSEREKAQKLNEQHQAILSKLLREEDNKYCADCEAKGESWHYLLLTAVSEEMCVRKDSVMWELDS